MSPPMRVIEISEPGGPDVLRLNERERPVPAPGEILIRVHAAGLNGADLMQRRGNYPPPSGISDLPGLEVAGEVTALGEGVSAFQTGQHVCALLAGGGYAEYCAVPAAHALPLPEGTDFISGAAIIETAATVCYNLFDRAHLQDGEKLLVHGGTSGIGTTAIQLAKLAGVETYCTVGSADKAAAARALGAARAINYKTESFADIIKQETDGGVDVILDIIGQPYLEDNLRSLRPDGRLVFIAFSGGRHGELDIARIMLKQLTLTGSTLRSKSSTRKAAIIDQVRHRVWPALADRTFAPVIDRTFPMEQAASAHEYLESGSHIGKVVLTMA